MEPADYRSIGPAEKAFRVGVGVCCAYEIFALATRRMPTISNLCRRSHVFEAAFTVAWLAHIHIEKNKMQTGMVVKANPADLRRITEEVRAQLQRYNQRGRACA